MKKSMVLAALGATLALGPIVPAHEGHQQEHNHPYPANDFSLDRGQRLYRQYCATCHGITGYNPGPFPDYMDPRPTNFLDRQYMVMKARVDLFESVRDGRPGTRMKPWNDRLSEDEIWDVVAWVEHLFNHARHRAVHKH